MQPSDIGWIPYILSERLIEPLNDIIEGNVDISRRDGDSFETSWDFKKQLLI